MSHHDNGMSLRAIAIEYDNIYNEMQALLDKHTPCKGPNGEPCIRKTFCCDRCKHLSDTGCTVKAMWCKFWLCGRASAVVNEEFVKERDALKARFRTLPFAIYTDGRYSKKQYMTAVIQYRKKAAQRNKSVFIVSDLS